MRVRQHFSADCISLKTIVRQAVRVPLPLVRLVLNPPKSDQDEASDLLR
ncbi:MAG: hypothetical protein JW959_04955 [Pirellulales bacterium]|nr:hypothetical protein [Pirellulales bacterium]